MLHRKISVILSFIFLMLLLGCEDSSQLTGSSSDTDSSGSVLTSFNLSSIEAGTAGPNQLVFTWTAASTQTGVDYTVCMKNTAETNNCDALATVTDTLTTTVQLNNVLAVVEQDFFVLATLGGQVISSSEAVPSNSVALAMIGYFKASNTGQDDYFGSSVAISDDGTVMAVGAQDEGNGATGIITDGSEVSDIGAESFSGAVYIFEKNNGVWTQTAYVKASNTGSNDAFGQRLALSGDGTQLAVSAPFEDNSATGVITNGSEVTDSGTEADSGAVYLFKNTLGTWAQEAYVKASNTGNGDLFGRGVALNYDGTVLAVGAYREDNAVAGLVTDGSEVTDTGTASDSGAAYIFNKSGGNWSQAVYLKASNTGDSDYFGIVLALSGDGLTLGVTAYGEDNSATGVITDGSETTDSGTESNSGAVYLFENSGGWSQTAYVKASNTGASDGFGEGLAFNHDGTLLVVGAPFEDNSAAGVITDGSEGTDIGTELNSGAVYVFRKSGGWSQEAYIKASNPGSIDSFGGIVDVSADGATIVVGANGEDNGASGVITDSSEVTDSGNEFESGAVYRFSYSNGSWEQTAYIKASNAGDGDRFGRSVSISGDGSTLLVGAREEDNAATGPVFDGSELTDVGTATDSGAVYLY